MSTPHISTDDPTDSTSEPHGEDATATGGADETSTTGTAVPRRRGRGPGRKKPADSPQAEAADDDENVVYLNENDRLNQIQGRIRTKKGHWLRPLTDLGTTERYMDSYGDDSLYVIESSKWRDYNGKHWRDSTGDRELHARLKTVIRGIYSEAEQCATEQRKAIREYARRAEMAGVFKSTMGLLESVCSVSVDDFDRGSEGDTLNLTNGTLDLETLELRPHSKADMLSKFSPVVYDPAATAPNWLQHLEWALPDPATRETVQRFMGYALTTETREQKMLCFYGQKGRNGKGVIIRAMERLLGYDPTNASTAQYSYAHAAETSLMLAAKRNVQAATPEVADLVGKRFVSVQETSEGQKFDGARIKSLTGGDAQRARFLNQNPFQFTPVAKYCLATNHQPEVHGDDPALWRRLLLVNFPNSIDDAGTDNDTTYEARIQDEISGILNWALEGLRLWRESGLAISDEIRAATAAYRKEQDLFGEFVDECLEPAEAHLVKAGAVYGIYRDWCTARGSGALAQQRFLRMLRPRIPGLYEKRTGNPPERYYGGLRFRDGVELDTFHAGRGKPQNPIERPDPSAPPEERTAEWDRIRRAQARAAAAQQANSSAEPTEDETAPQAAPVPPAASVSMEGWSRLCGRDQHDECQRDRASGWITGEECLCPCHEGDDGGETMPMDFEPTPDPAAVPDLSDDELEMLAELHADAGIDSRIDAEPEPEPVAPEPEPEPVAETGRYSERAFRPWTIKPSAYVDLATGEGICDDGTTFTVAKRGQLASLAELLRALPQDISFVHLTGATIGTDTTVMTWANTRLPKGWTQAGHGHSSDEVRDRISLRYQRPGRDGKAAGTRVTIYRGAGWIDRDQEEATSPAELRAAFALLIDGLRATFGSVVDDKFGVPIKGTPASTGLELARRTLPRKRGGAAHQYPILNDDLQALIRAHCGQGRNENFCITTHPSAGAHIPDRIPGMFVYDMRFAYAGLFDIEMPCGPVVLDQVPEIAMQGRSWEPCLYEVRVTVPQGWEHLGRFRCRDATGEAWEYPSEPGRTFVAWAWERALIAADRDGWKLGEHVQILQRVRFTGPKTKPLATFGQHLRELRDEWIPASKAPKRIQKLAQIMARQIAIATIGKLAAAPYDKLFSCPIEDMESRPDNARRSNDQKRWEWRVPAVGGRDDLMHPEWSAYIWERCRDWLYDHPTQDGAGLCHVPRGELLAARTDGYWTTTPQPITDTGKVGHFRVQLAHNEPLNTPRTYTDLNVTRATLLTAAESEADQ